MSVIDRKQRILDIYDERWTHPECTALWHLGEPPKDAEPVDIRLNPFAFLVSSEFSQEEKLTYFEGLDLSSWSVPLDESKATVETYMAPGCPEEPGAPEVKVWVYTPKGIELRPKMPTMFYCFGGGMTLCLPRVLPIENFAVKYGCILVAAEYRNSTQGKYPASINDCHAAYQWMFQNAEALHVDVDNVVLFGESTGGHLATCLPFRLMRYGYSPRAVVAVVPITDDRESKLSSDFRGITWTGESVRASYSYWMGQDYASDTVGPEAFANHATVDDCVGYPPLFIHSAEWDPSSDYDREFAGKVKAAHSFVSYHLWGGVGHNINNLDGVDRTYIDRLNRVIDEDVMDAFTYDLRRPWVMEQEA